MIGGAWEGLVTPCLAVGKVSDGLETRVMWSCFWFYICKKYSAFFYLILI